MLDDLSKSFKKDVFELTPLNTVPFNDVPRCLFCWLVFLNILVVSDLLNNGRIQLYRTGPAKTRSDNPGTTKTQLLYQLSRLTGPLLLNLRQVRYEDTT